MCGKGVGNELKYWKNKIPTLSFGHFWANFSYVSDPSHTILKPLRTQEHLWV